MKDIFILNTGPSLNLITGSEKDHIRENISISVNTYLIWYELLDIIPDYHIFIDNDNNSGAIIEETLKIHREKKLTTKLIFSKANYERHKKLFIDYNIEPFDIIKSYHAASWAHTPEDPFFHMNISGVALNWMCMKYGYSFNFKFLGYDGGEKSHFWTPTASYLRANNLISMIDARNVVFLLPNKNDYGTHTAETFFKCCSGKLVQVATEKNFLNRLYICNSNSKMLKKPFQYCNIKNLEVATGLSG